MGPATLGGEVHGNVRCFEQPEQSPPSGSGELVISAVGMTRHLVLDYANNCARIETESG